MSEIYEEEDREGYPPMQLPPLKGGRYKTVLHGPPGTEVGDLHCDLEPFEEEGMRGIVTHSGWKPSPEQVGMLEAGAHIRLSVWQHPIPPLAVNVEPPVCECHGEKMDYLYDGREGMFLCRHISTEGGEHGSQNGAPASGFEQAKAEFSPQPGADPGESGSEQDDERDAHGG